jgi:hypothetical protein
MEQSDDRGESLFAIQSRHPNKSLITRLVDMRKFTLDQEKSIRFVRELECLTYTQPRPFSVGRRKRSFDLGRTRIDAFNERSFVALSYTWNPSLPYEKSRPRGKYRVVQADWEGSGQSSRPLLRSKVRDRVFDRVTKYMMYKEVKYLWIDKHCIKQTPGSQKEIGMQAMDMVYSVSQHPIALLARPIRSEGELELLVQILSGELVQEDRRSDNFHLCCGPSTASRAFELLQGITNDFWWTRGWTFQENYRALPRMTLLMPHCPSLEKQKHQAMRRTDLGSLRGELCIMSWIFHQEATRFCLAFEKRRPTYRSQCRVVLKRAPKYTILLRRRDENGHKSNPTPMSPRIISDISERGLERAWDRLAITANCCQYTVRLDSTRLSSQESSVSLSMLGLYLMNGELLSNHPADAIHPEVAARLTVEDFIDLQSYKEYPSPPADPPSLTFNKGCRLFRPVITQMGMQAMGYVWRVRNFLSTARFSQSQPWEDQSRNGLELRTRRRLRQLANVLYENDEDFLANELDMFLSREANVGHTENFAMRWMRDMAERLVAAIDNRQALLIAQLVGHAGPKSSNGAIFIADTSIYVSPRFVFTSFWPKRSEGEIDYNDLDRHMSLAVDCGDERLNIPQLFTKNWIHGLCFYKACRPRKVLFPWPESIAHL